MESKGYMGKIAEVNLTTEKITIRDFPEEIAKKYVGGSGFGAKVLYDETGPETDPLGPDNPLIFATGPVTGTRSFNSDRFEVITKSPKTGIYGEASCGGHWGSRFKKCGFDALIIRGKASKPVYLRVTEDTVEIQDAADYWGKDTFYTHEKLKALEGNKSEAACIGVSGEMMLPIAAIIAEGRHGRAAGRTGVGAVMGSKNLKAVTVNGDKTVEAADKELILSTNKSITESMKKGTLEMKEAGTTCAIDYFEEIGNLPLRNWAGGNWREGAEKITGYTTRRTHRIDDSGCGACPVQCGKVVLAKGGDYNGEAIAGPEYETTGLFGSNCLIDDYDIIIKENEICNRYGVDTIAAANMISFAMEAYEGGLITKEQTNGLDLRFGNGEAAVEALKMIVNKEGFLGNLLYRGVREAAEQLGGNSRGYAMHVKGLEFPAHDPRARFSLALAYATSNRGACHLAFTHDYEEGFVEHLGAPATTGRFSPDKAEMTARMQDWACIFDSLCMCKFGRYGGIMVEQTIAYLNGATGWDMAPEEFMKTGERIFNLKRMYNVRHGVSRRDDTLPSRILTKRRGGGTSELPPFGSMLSDYYKVRGWDELGIPTAEKLTELGLEECLGEAPPAAVG
jgi:aldehyde:ferredoxin oxidoreductase